MFLFQISVGEDVTTALRQYTIIQTFKQVRKINTKINAESDMQQSRYSLHMMEFQLI